MTDKDKWIWPAAPSYYLVGLMWVLASLGLVVSLLWKLCG